MPLPSSFKRFIKDKIIWRPVAVLVFLMFRMQFKKNIEKNIEDRNYQRARLRSRCLANKLKDYYYIILLITKQCFSFPSDLVFSVVVARVAFSHMTFRSFRSFFNDRESCWGFPAGRLLSFSLECFDLTEPSQTSFPAHYAPFYYFFVANFLVFLM